MIWICYLKYHINIYTFWIIENITTRFYSNNNNDNNNNNNNKNKNNTNNNNNNNIYI